MVAIDDGPDLDLAGEASANTARVLRRRVEHWLRSAGAEPPTVEDLGLAVYEALANAAEHAYPPGHPDPVIRLQTQLDGDRVQIVVSDRGSWSSPDERGYRGRGFTLMRGLVESVDVEPTPQGTCVRLRAPLASAGQQQPCPPGRGRHG